MPPVSIALIRTSSKDLAAKWCIALNIGFESFLNPETWCDGKGIQSAIPIHRGSPKDSMIRDWHHGNLHRGLDDDDRSFQRILIYCNGFETRLGLQLYYGALSWTDSFPGWRKEGRIFAGMEKIRFHSMSSTSLKMSVRRLEKRDREESGKRCFSTYPSIKRDSEKTLDSIPSSIFKAWIGNFTNWQKMVEWKSSITNQIIRMAICHPWTIGNLIDTVLKVISRQAGIRFRHGKGRIIKHILCFLRNDKEG